MNQHWKRQKKHGKKKQNWWKWLSENEIADSNSLKPFEFERKTNIRDINSSSSDNEEEGAEAVIWRCSAAGPAENIFLEILQKFTGKHLCQSLFSNKVAGLLWNF